MFTQYTREQFQVEVRFAWMWDAENQDHMWERHETTAEIVEEVFYDDEPVHTGNVPPHKAERLMLGLVREGHLLVVPYRVVQTARGIGFRAVTAYYADRGEWEWELYLRLREQQLREGN